MTNRQKRILVFLLLLLTSTLPRQESALAQQSIEPLNGQIVFSSDRDGNMEIYVMQSDGSNVRRLTFDDGRDVYPDWSPDGQRIVFESFRNVPSDIFIMNKDGSSLINLTPDLTPGCSYPVWSPDGTRIAFTSSTNNGEDVYVINTDGTGLTKIVDGNDSLYNLHPAWSPDGSSILFVETDFPVSSREYGAYDLKQLDLETYDVITISGMDTYGTPDWSGINNTILFHVPFGLSGTVIRAMTPDGTLLDSLTTPPDEDQGQKYDAYASWSPDGTRFVFHSEYPSASDRSQVDFDIFVANADGSGLVNLTPDNTADDMFPDWQPLFPSTAAAGD